MVFRLLANKLLFVFISLLCFKSANSCNPLGTAKESLSFLNLLKGDARLDYLATGAQGTPVLTAQELKCTNFGATCRWRNLDGDQFQWERGLGEADSEELNSRSGTSFLPSPPYAAVFPGGTYPDTDVALLVSDIIPCSRNNPEIAFKYWTSVNTYLRVCTRKYGSTDFEFCSAQLKNGDPGPAFVSLPDLVEPFEIVMEAGGFILPDDFVLLDDIEFIGEICSTQRSSPNEASYPGRSGGGGGVGGGGQGDNVGFEAQIAQENSVNSEVDDSFACHVLQCDFDADDFCSFPISDGESAWQIGKGHTGNRVTGIPYDRKSKVGTYAYVRGPEIQSIYKMPPFDLGQSMKLKFSYYKASIGPELELFQNGQRLFWADRSNSARFWRDANVTLRPGEFQEIAFVTKGLARHEYIALDNFRLFGLSDEQVCTIK